MPPAAAAAACAAAADVAANCWAKEEFAAAAFLRPADKLLRGAVLLKSKEPWR